MGSFNPHVVFGPPGTGKTSTLLGYCERELEHGLRPGELAFVTFTRAARGEAKRRVGQCTGQPPDDFAWLRTIHSAAYRLLDLVPERVMGQEHWDELSARYGYQFTRLEAQRPDPSDDPKPLPRATPDDVFRHAADLAQNLRVPPEEALARCAPPGTSARAFQAFLERLGAYKREHGLFGFCDMLEAVLERGLRPPVRVAFVDEAQDLSPLQIAVVEMWFGNCERVYVAGDDDQAIYTFHGADPRWLRRLAARCSKETLEASHRVPQLPHAFAEQIIRRNRSRVPKRYGPKEETGSVVFRDRVGALAEVDGSVETFVLARNRLYLKPFAKGLVQRQIPFIVEGRGARSPLSDRRLVTAVRLAVRLAAGITTCVEATDLRSLLAFVPKGGPVSAEAREQVKRAAANGEVFSIVDPDLQSRIRPLLEALRAGPPLDVLGLIDRDERAFFQELLGEDGSLPEPRVVLTSIHGSKGRQAELVVVVPDMTRATYSELRANQSGFEAENRVAYVAATRTRQRLVIADPMGRRRYDFPAFRGLRDGASR